MRPPQATTVEEEVDRTFPMITLNPDVDAARRQGAEAQAGTGCLSD
jgi:hypothetical protein